MDDDLDRALKDLPVRQVDPRLAEAVRRMARRELLPPARLLQLSAAAISLIYLAWAVSYAGALYH